MRTRVAGWRLFEVGLSVRIGNLLWLDEYRNLTSEVAQLLLLYFIHTVRRQSQRLPGLQGGSRVQDRTQYE